MTKLVFIENGKTVTDSLTVAASFAKEHKRVMQDIRLLGCSEEFRQHHFVLSSYRTEQNKELPKYILTEQGFALLAMGYTGHKATEFKEQYISEFHRMRSTLEAAPFASLSKEMQAIFIIDKRSQEVEQRVEQLENNTTVDYGQQQTLKQFANRRVLQIIGGKLSAAYRDSSLRGKVYSALWNDFKEYFTVNSMCNTARKDLDRALDYIDRWSAPNNLLMEIEAANAQITI
ncbi:ORF6C domain-containing protein [Paenibacillus sp. GCM10027626]|uniref:ORF6C domain-containing protein n=1 Tax=Paenibacillus sp. GCM10027626 TaxID=3273411 RepID=UPI003642AAA6